MTTASYCPTVHAARRAAWHASQAARMGGLGAAAAREAASNAARAAYRAVELEQAVKDAVEAVDRYASRSVRESKLPAHFQPGRLVEDRWGADVRAALEEIEVAELRERRTRKAKLLRGLELALRG